MVAGQARKAGLSPRNQSKSRRRPRADAFQLTSSRMLDDTRVDMAALRSSKQPGSRGRAVRAWGPCNCLGECGRSAAVLNALLAYLTGRAISDFAPLTPPLAEQKSAMSDSDDPYGDGSMGSDGEGYDYDSGASSEPGDDDPRVEVEVSRERSSD